LVSKHGAATLMLMIRNLCYIFERARSVYEIQPPQHQQVKGTNFILDALRACQQVIDFINKQNGLFTEINNEMIQWIDYLDKNYKEPTSAWKVTLSVKDARVLAEITQNWLDSIFVEYNKSDTVLIQERALFSMYDDLKKNLNKIGEEDLKDGISAIAHNFPTPAAMVLYRVAENVIREYYKKITKNDPGERTWGAMINDLEKIGNVDKTLLGYLHFLNKHRIDAAHPYRRYSQEESERILLELKALIEEL